MISTRYYLDCRVAKGEAPLKLCLRRRGQGAYLSTGIRLLPSQWDNRAQKVTAHPQKGALNAFLAGFKFKVDTYLRDLVINGSTVNMTMSQVRELCIEKFEGRRESTTLKEYWFRVCAPLSKSSRTLYHTSWRQVSLYDRNAETKLLTSCNDRWVRGYVSWLGKQDLTVNSRSTYLAKMKAVFNAAARDGIIQSDPSRGVSISFVPTRRRNLSAEQIRKMLHAPVKGEDERNALDLFALSFYLRAANPIDIVRMRRKDIFNGRIEYDRSKTGKHYSVRIEPEAQLIIDRHTDGDLLFPMPRYKNYTSFVVQHDKLLQRRAKALGLPDVTMYWARHTFASLAFELGYPMDLVSAALGHSLGGAPITSVYVAVQDYKVDELARAVYDAVK